MVQIHTDTHGYTFKITHGGCIVYMIQLKIFIYKIAEKNKGLFFKQLAEILNGIQEARISVCS